VLSVWLRVSAAEAVRRAGKAPGERPLMADPDRMEALLREREPHYRQAQLHLDTEAASPMEVARRIIDHLAER
jgi:shikimate kinase